MPENHLEIAVYDPSKAIASFHQTDLEKHNIYLHCVPQLNRFYSDIRNGTVDPDVILGVIGYSHGNPLENTTVAKTRLDKVIAELQRAQWVTGCPVILNHNKSFKGTHHRTPSQKEYYSRLELPYTQAELRSKFGGEVTFLKRSHDLADLEKAIGEVVPLPQQQNERPLEELKVA